MARTTAKKTSDTKIERLEARVSSRQKRLFQQAADLQGRSLTDFVVSTLQASATETIRQHEVVTLSRRDRDRFVKALLNPPPPNAALIRAVKRHREMTGG